MAAAAALLLCALLAHTLWTTNRRGPTTAGQPVPFNGPPCTIIIRTDKADTDVINVDVHTNDAEYGRQLIDSTFGQQLQQQAPHLTGHQLAIADGHLEVTTPFGRRQNRTAVDALLRAAEPVR